MILWLQAFHVIFLIAWFAGLFYLPRLYVYHSSCDNHDTSELFKVMEYKLYYYITMPAMVITAFFGLWMLYIYGLDYILAMTWLQIKLGLVVLLLGFHFYCGHLLKQFAQDNNQHPEKFYRIINEFPTIILISVVLLIYLRPM